LTWNWPIGHQELILRQTVKTNVHILVEVIICTSWSTEMLLAIVQPVTSSCSKLVTTGKIATFHN